MTKGLFALLLTLETLSAFGAQALRGVSDFSAEIVETTRGDARPKITKVYVHGTRMRMIDATADQKNDGGYMLTDYAKGSVYAVMPAQKMYIDMSETLSQTGQLISRLFHPRNPEDACPDWQQIFETQHKTATCKKLGGEILNGRTTVKYEGVDSDSNRALLWVDTKLGFLIKIQDKDKVTVWQNIQEESQPENLFVIPAGYQRTDMQHMMEHMTDAKPPKS
jgi:hypothetical protein